MGNGIILLIITIVIISAVVGAIAQFLNKLNEAAAAPPKRPVPRGRREEGGDAPVRQSDKDMDRFLAEIERLRKKNAETGDQPKPQQERPRGGQQSGRPAVARPVSPSSTRQSERPRGRLVAEPAEPQTPRRRGVDTSPMAAPPVPVAPGSLSPAISADALPVAMVVTPTSATGAPATRVTRLPQRARPTPKTNLAMNLTNLLNGGQGIAMAVILQEILGPPKSKA